MADPLVNDVPNVDNNIAYWTSDGKSAGGGNRPTPPPSKSSQADPEPEPTPTAHRHDIEDGVGLIVDREL